MNAPRHPASEPARKTSRSLLRVQEELVQREPIFHRPEFGTTRADFDGMMAEGFWEVGASGRYYGRAHVLDVLEQRGSMPHRETWRAEDFYCQEVAPSTYLLTYTLHQGPRVTRRTTLWRRQARGWAIVFHQGTVVETADEG